MLKVSRSVMSNATNRAAQTSAGKATAPPAVRNWLKSQYRDLPIQETWLLQTVQDGQKSTASTTALVQHVKQSLLNTSLKESLAKGTLPVGVADAKSKQPSTISDILVEIVDKLDIGVSAQTQLDVLEARSQARRTAGGSAEIDSSDQQAGSAADIKDVPDADHMADFNAAEEAASLPSTVFPRSTLQLTLSDGFTKVKAFEHRRVPQLSMTEPPMGSKILLKRVTVKSGHILLSPDSIELKGGRVESLDSQWEARMIDQLRSKLGKPPAKYHRQNTAAGAEEQQVDPPAAAKDKDKRANDDLSDDDEAAMFQEMHGQDINRGARPAAAQAAASEASGATKRQSQPKRLKLPPKSSSTKPGSDRALSTSATSAVGSTTSQYFASGSKPPTEVKPVQVKEDDFFDDDDFELFDAKDAIVVNDSD